MVARNHTCVLQSLNCGNLALAIAARVNCGQLQTGENYVVPIATNKKGIKWEMGKVDVFKVPGESSAWRPLPQQVLPNMQCLVGR